MKTTIKTLALASLMMFGGSLSAQQFGTTATVIGGFPSKDQDLSKLPKMERDIIILQNVLGDMFRDSERQFYSSSSDIKGIHIPGKGVIFNIGDNSSSRSVIYSQNSYFNLLSKDESKEDDEKEIDIDQANKERENKLKELSQEFLLNYGSILSEVKDNEMIMLNVKFSSVKQVDKDSKARTIASRQGTVEVFLDGRNQNIKRITSSIQFKDLKDLLSGKLSFEAAKGKVTTKVIDDETKESSDTKIMAGILDDLFQSNFDGVYRKTSNTSWTYFEGFGLMYNIGLTYNTGGNSARVAFYTSQRADAVKEDTEEKKKDEEQLKKVEESFDDLIELAKESLVTYGRTLRSVKSDEVIILNINFSSFFTKSTLPKSVRISVNKSQIDQFSKGGISLDQLKKDIDVKKLTSSINSSAQGIYFYEPSTEGAQAVYDKVRVLKSKAEGKN
ncbi:hypothetical protein [Roseivirga sp.]|uniref:hypothetical protein n=1 Tax=Roseivirga sp. TaxID=1964215 RepID=UPI002B268B5E|nr:hypothetical protein [Roseivirga sp.]